MQAKEIIQKKRDGLTLSPEELKQLLYGYLEGEIKDYQMASWLMAVYFQGLDSKELLEWTRLMWHSGRTFPKPKGSGYWIDKHSTGGVGDKTSLLLVPIVASVCERLFGDSFRIPMISGRSLGHTGGTLDKLESVPGFSASVSIDEAESLLNQNHYFMMGQTEDMAPADRLIYALRDVTSTVESIPLIVSSILSKKFSENLNGIVFDVKVGGGAFMKTLSRAQQLAERLTGVSKDQGLDAVAVLTRMDEPLGTHIGNLLEVEECSDFLEGTARDSGLLEVTSVLAAWMVRFVSGGKLEISDALGEVERELSQNRALVQFRAMFEAQGGNLEAFERARKQREKDLSVYLIKAERDGWLSEAKALPFGILVGELGGARASKKSKIDIQVGIKCKKKVGDEVKKGDVLFEVFHRKESDIEMIDQRLKGALAISETPVPKESWIVEVCHG